jgi:hypothetical protein
MLKEGEDELRLITAPESFFGVQDPDEVKKEPDLS